MTRPVVELHVVDAGSRSSLKEIAKLLRSLHDGVTVIDKRLRSVERNTKRILDKPLLSKGELLHPVFVTALLPSASSSSTHAQYDA